MPDADLRRQRAAFYRGVVRTTAIAAVVVAAMTVMVVIAVGQAKKRAARWPRLTSRKPRPGA
jgi:uncharacterized protein (DUF3084 family)